MKNSREVFEELKIKFDEFLEDGSKWSEKSNKTAAKRARKTSLYIEKMLKLFRKFSVAEVK